jgi:outer membrane immunogenic protein
MRSLFLAGVIAATVVTGSQAADAVIAYDPVPVAPVAAVYDWSGIYVGGLVGYGWGNSLFCDETCEPGYPDFNLRGMTAGVTAGYNFQSGNWVYGIEGDYSWSGIDGSSGDTIDFGCSDGCFTEITSYGTLRGRIGYAFGNILPFATAGVALTTMKAGFFDDPQDRTTEAGFTVGGGVEIGLTEALTTKVEYLYVDNGGDFNFDDGSGCGGSCFTRDNDFHTLRVGLNYRF